jgi:hypothetical protein
VLLATLLGLTALEPQEELTLELVSPDPIASSIPAPVDTDSEQFKLKLQACLEEIGKDASDEEAFACLGISERVAYCSDKVESESIFDLFQCVKDAKPPRDLYSIPIEELRDGMERAHPLSMMVYALRLSEELNRPQEALFWFYASQLRWRTRMACHEFEPGGEGALFGSMMSVSGAIFNGWASGNIDVWLDTIDRAHAWDLATEERFEEDKKCTVEAEEQRAGMLKLKQSILDNRTELEAAAAEKVTVSGSVEP